MTDLIERLDKWRKALRQTFSDMPAMNDTIDETFDALTAQAAEIARLTAERDEARDYAFEATKTITGLTVGGSEFFSGKLGDRHKADLPFCEAHIRKRIEDAWRGKIDAIKSRKAAEAQVADAYARGLRDAAAIAAEEAWPEIMTQQHHDALTGEEEAAMNCATRIEQAIVTLIPKPATEG